MMLSLAPAARMTGVALILCSALIACPGAMAKTLTSSYVAKALESALAGNYVDGDDLLVRWTGDVDVHFHDSCDSDQMVRLRQKYLAEGLSRFIDQLNHLQDSIALRFVRLPCGAIPLEDGSGGEKFGIAVAIGGSVENVEKIIKLRGTREGALPLLDTIKRGSASQLDTGCSVSAYRTPKDHEYKAALVYVDLGTVQVSAGQCARATMLSALGFHGDMRQFPEALQSFSSYNEALSDLDQCLVTLLYSRRVRPITSVGQLVTTAQTLAPELCNGVIPK